MYQKFCDVDRPPPSYRTQGADDKINRRLVPPEAIWQMIKKTADSSLKLHDVIQARSDDPTAGGSVASAWRWERLIETMYLSGLASGWPNVNHLCISVDGSTHSYNDVLVGLGYSWENNKHLICLSSTW